MDNLAFKGILAHLEAGDYLEAGRSLIKKSKTTPLFTLSLIVEF